MKYLTKFKQKARKFIYRNSFLKPFVFGLREAFRKLRFWINKSERENGYATFQQLQSVEEYFFFSKKWFRPHQKKYEIIEFIKFAQLDNINNVCEIGTAFGGTTFLLSQALPSVSLIISVDLYTRNKFKSRYFSKSSQQMSFIDGSSYSTKTIAKFKQILGNNQLDLLFIDGDHRYEGVKQDFLCYRHLVRENGIIAFHDIIHDHFSKYGIETRAYTGGVPDFWSKIKLVYPFHEFVENPEQNGLGIGVIRYSSQISLPEDL